MFRLSTSHLIRYGGALASAIVALLLSLLLQPIIRPLPSILFFGAVALSAGYGGLGPGIFTTILSVIFLDYIVLPPYGGISYSAQDLLILILFMCISLLISTLYERNKRAAAKAEQQREALRVTLLSIGDAVIATDTKAAVTFLNPQAEALTGWRLEEAINQDIQKVFRIVDEQSRQVVENPVFKVLRGEKKVGLANHSILIAKDGTESVIEDSAAPIQDSKGHITGTVLTFRDIHERRQAEYAQQLLIDVSDVLASALDYEATYRKIAALAVPKLADLWEIVLLENGQLRQPIVAHADPEKQQWLERYYETTPAPWNAAQEAVRTAQSVLRSDLSDDHLLTSETDTQFLQNLRNLRLKSQLYVPLRFNDQTVGVIGFNRSAGQPNFVQAEIRLAEELARRIAASLENARLYQQMHEAAQAAQRSADRLARTQAITAALEDALLPIQVAKTIVDQTIQAIDGAYGSLVALIEEKDRKLHVIYSAGYNPEARRQWENMALDADLPMPDMVRRGEPLFLETPDEWATRYPNLAPWVTSQSLALLPLLVEGKVIGGMVVSFNERRPFTAEDRAFLNNLARKCAQALHRAQLFAAEKISQMRLKRFIDSNIIGINYATSDGQVIDANDSFLQLVGHTREEMQAGQIDWLKITPPEFLPLDQKAIAEGEQTGKYTPFEKEYIHKDGHRVPILIGGTLVEGTWVSFIVDLTERKRAERRLRLLTEASTILASSLDFETTLKTVAQITVPAIADWCAVHLIEMDGSVKQVALAHKDPAKVAWAYELRERYPADPHAPTGLYQVIRTGKAEFYPELTDEMLVAAAKNEDELRIMREIGFSSAIIVPLKIQERILGALQLVSTEGKQHFTADDLTLAEDIARRAAVAVDNARLYREIHQERERLQVTLSSIGDGVIATDAQGHITFINPVGEALTGWTLAEALNKGLEEIFPIINASTRQTVESPVAKVLREGLIAGLANHTLLIAKDGSEIPIDDSGAPIRDTNGELMGVILVFRDIRERREAEVQLETTLQRTYDLYATSRQIGVAHTPQGILNALLTSRYIENTAQAAIIAFEKSWQDDPTTYEVVAALDDSTLPGFAPDHTLSSSPLTHLFSSNQSVFLDKVNDDARLEPATKALLTQQDITQLMFFPLWAASGCFGLLVLYCTAPHQCTEDDFRHIRIFADQVAIMMDNVRLLDAERRARREAEYANELKLKFLAMISHELRTPLTSIKGFVSSLLATDVSWSADDQHQFISIISEEADKLTDLISQLLDLSQLQAGTLRIQPTVQSVQNIFDIATAQLTTLAHRHHLIVQIAPDLPAITADGQRIAEVLTNLVGNAVKYAPEGTPITVEAVPQDGMVRVSVTDEGPGIPPENREVVFEAFRQLERKSSQPLKGAGLGLAICKGLIEAHHGRMWISDGPHSGTTISFALPIATLQPA
ncbi:MAG: PAS domain S-box protein [Aggregatilineales bacterium]